MILFVLGALTALVWMAIGAAVIRWFEADRSVTDHVIVSAMWPIAAVTRTVGAFRRRPRRPAGRLPEDDQ